MIGVLWSAMDRSLSTRQILKFHIEAGADECIADQPLDRFRDAPAIDRAAPAPAGPDASLQGAWAMAAKAGSLDELRLALESFDGCSLKKTATNLVFGDGGPKSRIVLIGEAPGAEEDRQGIPFVGPSGKLLDRMLRSIGLDRKSVFISNTVYWRPPGNRNPTTAEMAVCLPFVERMIELIDPDVLVAMGGPAAKALLAQSEGVSKLRGKWFTFSTPRLASPIAATAIFHPAYLLRSPLQKRAAWKDMVAIKGKLDSF
ncbi:MAG: uracil-DNA glycosylase [Rhodospirillales bacterium]